MEFIDTHAHLYDPAFDEDRAEVIERYRNAGGRELICVAFDLATVAPAAGLAEEYEFIYASAGIHPHDAGDVPENFLEQLAEWGRHPGVVAVGEMGLDYYRDLSPRYVQRQVFRQQLALARELNKPVIIHDREAHADVLDILRRDGAGRAGGVMHCFSGDREMAGECIEMGLYISLAGPVTYKNAGKVKEVAASVPLDRLLIETDAPYLAPAPKRGRRNEPAYVQYVAEEVARLRDMEPEKLAAACAANARRLFGLE